MNFSLNQTEGVFFWEPVRNENSWNGFLVRFLLPVLIAESLCLSLYSTFWDRMNRMSEIKKLVITSQQQNG